MFSKACKYGIRAVLYLSVHTSEDTKLGVKEIAEELDVPKPFLAKILQQLSRHNLISSSKGTGGGFYLSEADRQISLRDIIECIDGQEMFTACILGLPVCSSENPCPLHDEAQVYRMGIADLVGNNSINDFAGKIISKKLSL
ncbi:MAG: Rrf2 family transcriptional regulator [Sinomicrobium sp.]|nr:Rrf2 family transcriptional regulator [Sinomicrobium sp.]